MLSCFHSENASVRKLFSPPNPDRNQLLNSFRSFSFFPQFLKVPLSNYEAEKAVTNVDRLEKSRIYKYIHVRICAQMWLKSTPVEHKIKTGWRAVSSYQPGPRLLERAYLKIVFLVVGGSCDILIVNPLSQKWGRRRLCAFTYLRTVLNSIPSWFL